MKKILLLFCWCDAMLGMAGTITIVPESQHRFRSAAQAIIETLRLQDEELYARVSSRLHDLPTGIHSADAATFVSPPSPHVTPDIVKQLRAARDDYDLDRMIRDLIKDQTISEQETEIELARTEHGHYKTRVKCGTACIGTIMAALITTMGTLILSLISNQC